MGDMTTVSFYATPDFDEQNVLQLSHEFRVGGEGLRFGASYTYAWTHPDAGKTTLTETLLVEIGRAHVCTPVTNAHLVCRLLLDKKNQGRTLGDGTRDGRHSSQ